MLQDDNRCSMFGRFVVFGICASKAFYSCYGDDIFNDLSFYKNTAIGAIVIAIFVWKQNGMYSMMVSYILATIREKNQYQMIFDNLEESIIIMGPGNIVELINDKFLIEF